MSTGYNGDFKGRKKSIKSEKWGNPRTKMDEKKVCFKRVKKNFLYKNPLISGNLFGLLRVRVRVRVRFGGRGRRGKRW